MNNFEIYEFCGKLGVKNCGVKIISGIHDSVKFYDDFIKVGIFGLYQLHTPAGFLMFADMYEEIFVYTKYIACKQEEGDWIVFDKVGTYINTEYYEDIYCDENYLAVKEKGCWKVLDKANLNQ